MSSWPGPTLEDFLAWNFDFVIVGKDDPNVSLGMAEAIGTIPARRRLTLDHVADVAESLEPHRESMEYALDRYDEDRHGSWRDYSIEVATRAPDSAFDKAKAVLDSIVSSRVAEQGRK